MCVFDIMSASYKKIKLWEFPLPVSVLWVAGWGAAAHSAS